jgi:hypothetical protein
MPNNELDLRGLDEIFSDTNRIDNETEEKKVDFDTEIDYNDAVDALKKNIHNANQLLEKIQHEMNNGNFSARLAEVAGTVINSVTQASKEILTDKNQGEYMDVRKALVLLKEKELQIKEAKIVRGPSNNTTNVLIASREDILKSISDGSLKKIGQSEEVEEIEIQTNN